MPNKYICFKCKKVITEKTVVKKSLGKNFHIFMASAVWTPKESDEQWGMFCPHCDALHPFGFEPKKEKQNAKI